MIKFIADTFWGTYPAWGSFIVALGGFILLLIKMLSKKVDHVEGVVKELQQQNKTFREQSAIFKEELELNKKRFAHETKVPVSETQPVFKKDKQLPFKENSSIQLILINDGTKAQEIRLENEVIDKATWHATLRPTKAVISKGDKIEIIIYSGDPGFEGIKFDLSYYDEEDIKHVQHIAKKYGGNFQIEPPT